jgi:hypothetical protein
MIKRVTKMLRVFECWRKTLFSPRPQNEERRPKIYVSGNVNSKINIHYHYDRCK